MQKEAANFRGVMAAANKKSLKQSKQTHKSLQAANVSLHKHVDASERRSNQLLADLKTELKADIKSWLEELPNLRTACSRSERLWPAREALARRAR